MSTRVFRCEDTTGRSWHILPGDVAHPLLDELVKAGFEQPRLPAQAYYTGVVRDRDLDPIVTLVDELAEDNDPDLDEPLLRAFDSECQVLYLLTQSSPT